MISLRDYVKSIDEARAKSADLDKINGKDASRNGTGGKTGFNEPTDNDASSEFLPKDQWDNNMKRLNLKFKAEDDFFIIGKAGWGKTSIIKSFAKKYGYEVITQYLDKCEATDLGGIPIAGEDKKTGKARRVTLMPEWAQYMKDHPEQNFLLFFDEMNQAAPDVMNALMPIVLEHEICNEKFDNFFVGAAGNFEDENEAVSELNGPLKSRFKPLIEWESNTTKTWESAINYMHREWDDIVSKELIDEIAKVVNVFENPREVEQKFIKRYVARFIEKGLEFDDVEEVADHLHRLIADYDELSRTQKTAIDKLAELTYETVKNGGKPASKGGASGRSGKGRDMIDDNIKNILKKMMQNGYITVTEDGKAVTYGISKENISVDFFDDETGMNSEMLRRLIDKFEQDGVKWKFQKNSEWQAKGYKDPTEDLLIDINLVKLLNAPKPDAKPSRRRHDND